jgi:hypothetical protein
VNPFCCPVTRVFRIRTRLRAIANAAGAWQLIPRDRRILLVRVKHCFEPPKIVTSPDAQALLVWIGSCQAAENLFDFGNGELSRLDENRQCAKRPGPKKGPYVYTDQDARIRNSEFLRPTRTPPCN